jgi:predicted metalloprotease with PDZ domain
MTQRFSRSLIGAALIAALAGAPFSRAGAQGTTPPIAVSMALAVDASEATRGILHMRETIPVSAGPLVLEYPKWIPGEHAPNGPIPNLATVVISGGGQHLTWTRDLDNIYAFHFTVPAGVTSLEVTFDYLGAQGGDYSSSRLATPNLLSLTWNKVLLTPHEDDYRTIEIAPTLTLPSADWKFGTALETTSQNGATVAFKPVTMEMLVDSPLDAGINVRKWPLGDFDGAPVELDAFADTPEELDVTDKTIDKFKNLVKEMKANYGARHFNHYTFLLTLSDEMPGEGVEHHQSSDDGSNGDFLTNPTSLVADGDLLPHEFNHSWDGKYRRPYDLATPNLQVPMEDDLLWVYEGMTQFEGMLQAERSGIWTRDQWMQALAGAYAYLDHTTGRLTRPLVDTATSGPFLYGAPRQWTSARRSVDFYDEGALMWLEADEIIMRESHGKKSIEDFCHAFFGPPDTGPKVVPYHRADVIAALNAVQPYDWTAFFHKRIDEVAPHPPDPFALGGYKLVYLDHPSKDDVGGRRSRGISAGYSVGITAAADGTIVDVVQGSAAAKAGVGPGMKIVGIDGRTLVGQGPFDDALKAAEHRGSLTLLLSGGGVYREVTIPYTGGPRYPQLERVDGTPDRFEEIAKPR